MSHAENGLADRGNEIANRVELLCKPAAHGECRVIAQLDGEDVHIDEFNLFKKYYRGMFARDLHDVLTATLADGSPVYEVDVNPDLSWVEEKLLAAARAGENGDSEPEELPKIVPFFELLEAYPHLKEPIIDGLLRRGETMNIIADPKRGKSWLAYSLALAVCIGDRWLGSFDCLPCKVLLIDNELHPETITHRIPVAADGLGISHSEFNGRLDTLTLRGRLKDLYGIAKILESVESGTYGLILLDAQYRSLPQGISENANADMTSLYNEVDRIAGRLDCAWVNVHHSSKGNQAAKSITDVGAGAGAQSRAADCHLVLREHEEPGCVVLESAVRSFKPVEPMTLKWTFPIWQPAVGVDPSAVKGRGTKREERQSEADRDACYTVIEGIRKLTAKKKKAAYATKRQLRRATGFSPSRLNRILDLLESKNTVLGKDANVGGKMSRVYWLKPDSPDSEEVVGQSGRVGDN